jgi:hypothetical protein
MYAQTPPRLTPLSALWAITCVLATDGINEGLSGVLSTSRYQSSKALSP